MKDVIYSEATPCLDGLGRTTTMNDRKTVAIRCQRCRKMVGGRYMDDCRCEYAAGKLMRCLNCETESERYSRRSTTMAPSIPGMIDMRTI